MRVCNSCIRFSQVYTCTIIAGNLSFSSTLCAARFLEILRVEYRLRFIFARGSWSGTDAWSAHEKPLLIMSCSSRQQEKRRCRERAGYSVGDRRGMQGGIRGVGVRTDSYFTMHAAMHYFRPASSSTLLTRTLVSVRALLTQNYITIEIHRKRKEERRENPTRRRRTEKKKKKRNLRSRFVGPNPDWTPQNTTDVITVYPSSLIPFINDVAPTIISRRFTARARGTLSSPAPLLLILVSPRLRNGRQSGGGGLRVTPNKAADPQTGTTSTTVSRR